MQVDNQIIVVDAGNSRVKFGLFKYNVTGKLPDCLGIAAQEINRGNDAVNLKDWVHGFLDLHSSKGTRAILSGSNLKAIELIKEVWPSGRCELVVKTDRSQFPLPILVDFPDKVGMDRLLNALAIKLIKPTNHLGVIVDSGTATTVDVVDQEGAFLGGAILPGLRLSAMALHHYTSQLPLVDVNLLTEAPLRPIGKNTHEAILNGILWGHLGAIHELVGRYAESCDGPVSCYLTGGAAPLLLPHLKQAFVHYPYLPLQGLALWDL